MPGESCSASLCLAARRGLVWWLTLVVILLLCTGCDRATPSPQQEEDAAPWPEAERIISLTPAITQMLIDMGKRDMIVGVSRDDDKALGLPVCGTFSDPLTARILSLKPDLVLTETVTGDAQQAPELLQDYALRDTFRLGVLPHSLSIADVEQSLIAPRKSLGRYVGDFDAAEQARQLFTTRLQRIADAVVDQRKRRVLMLMHPETLGAIGTGVTHAELLELAGAINAASQYDTGYLTLTRSQILQVVRPDVILIFEPGGQPLTDSDPRVDALKDLDIPAIKQQRVFVIDHSQAMLPSTALPEVLAQMARCIHPDQTKAINRALHKDELKDQANGSKP